MPGNKPNGSLGGLITAETGFELALVLPVATFVGWGIGTLLDHWLHQNWIYLPGLVVGIIAGFVQGYRLLKPFLSPAKPEDKR